MSAVSEVRPAICPLDCADTCSLSVTVCDDKVVSIKGSAANPYTDNAICSKVAKYFPEYVHGEQRLKYPLQRIGPRGSGQYQRISWEQALQQVHAGFSQAIASDGPQSVLGLNYGGPHGVLSETSLDRLFFNLLGATQIDRGPLCGGVRGAAYQSLFGAVPGMPPEQASQSDLIIVWGSNTTVSNLHLSRVISKAQKQGGQLVVIDPKRIAIAERADLYLQIKPGTDVVLAMALAAEMERRGHLDQCFIEQWVSGHDRYLTAARCYSLQDVETICGISSAQFEALLAAYQAAQCVALSIGNGMERGKSGGSALRAVMALQALTGNFGRVGAGVMAKQGLAFPMQVERISQPELREETGRVLNILDVSRVILDKDATQPIRAMMIYNHNPVATHPDQQRMIQALSSESVFIAGCDVVMTDSMKYADVILPAASVFEIEDIYGAYGQTYLQRGEPVIPLQGESLPNTEIFRRLAAQFGFDNPCFELTDKQLMDHLIEPDDARLAGYQPSELPLDQALLMNTPAGEPLILCDTLVPATDSGKIELFDAELEQESGFGVPRYEAVVGKAQYPWVIMSPSSSDRTNATFGGCKDSLQTQHLEIHPEDAQALGIKEGDTVRVWNDLGEVQFVAKPSDKVQLGVLYTPKGAWQASSSTQRTVNVLISADLRTDIKQGACYNDTFVNLEKC